MHTQSRFERRRFSRGLLQVADPKIWIASTIPVVLATTLAYRSTGRIHVGWLLLVLLGIYLIEVSKNAVNEFVDYQSGVDLTVAPTNQTPFSGGKRAIVDGHLTLREALAVAWAGGALGAAVGVIVVILRAPHVLWIGVIGLSLAVFYSAAPLKLAYRGLGELSVGTAFGPLLMLGAYLVQARDGAETAAILGIPIGLLIANVLWINQFPDYAADKACGKRNGVVRLGLRRAAFVHSALYLTAYASIAAFAVFRGEPGWILGLASLPLALKGSIVAHHHYGDVSTLIRANALCLQVYVVTGVCLTIASFL